MSLLPTILCFGLAASAGAPKQVALVEFDGIGVPPDEQAELRSAILEELRTTGAIALDRTADWMDGCLEDASCIADERQSGFLAVEVTRVGPLLQLELKLVSRSGGLAYEASRSSMAGNPLLGEELLASLDLLPDPVPEVVVKDPEPEVVDPAGAVPWWGWASAGGALVGVAVFAAGAGIAASDASTLEDPKSLGVAKEDARVRGPIALVAAVVGVGIAAAGTGVFLSSLGDE